MKQLRVFVVSVLLALLATGIYSRLATHEFIAFDDEDYITGNSQVAAGLTLDGITWAFTTTATGNWHPLTWISHMLDVQLFGMRAGSHHLVNLLFHGANAILLFLVLKGISGAFWRSALVAALFAAHPLHVESVAWAAERKDMLSSLFWMLTIGAYLRFARNPDRRRFLPVVFFFTLGLLAKPMLITLPFALLLLDRWPLGRWAPRDHQARSRGGRLLELVPPRTFWVEKIPLFLLAAASGGMTFYAQSSEGAVVSVDRLPFPLRLANAVVSYVRYLDTTLWPRDLSVYYPLADTFPPALLIATAIVALGLITVGVLAKARSHPFLVSGWLWYLGTLVPVIGLVQVGYQARADRYTYLPLIGIFFATVWGLAQMTRRSAYAQKSLIAAALTALVVLALVARIQAGFWKDGLTLFQHSLDVTSDNWLAYNGLGVTLAARGDLNAAVAAYRNALRLAPGFADTHNNLGIALAALGKEQEAIDSFSAALRIKPDRAGTYYNIGKALSSQGRIEEAIAHYRTALKLNPRNAEAHNNIGEALSTQGKIEEALDHFRAALLINPRLDTAHYNFGNALAAQGKIEEAVEHYRAALQANPGLAEAHNNLGSALDALGKHDESITHYQAALRINPGMDSAYHNLGNALTATGRLEEAIASYRAALRINPRFMASYNNLGNALISLGKIPEAIACLQTALQVNPRSDRAHNNLGRAFALLGRRDEAVAHFQIAIEINPSSPAARTNLLKMLGAQGNK